MVICSDSPAVLKALALATVELLLVDEFKGTKYINGKVKGEFGVDYEPLWSERKWENR